MGLRKKYPGRLGGQPGSTFDGRLDCGLSVMHEQCEEDDDRQRDADQPEKSAFAETHLESPASTVSKQWDVCQKVPPQRACDTRARRLSGDRHWAS
jgi:hypothetical protein